MANRLLYLAAFAIPCTVAYSATASVAAATVPQPTTTGIATLHKVDQDDYPLAACLDGSPPAYYFRPATTDAGRSKYVVYHAGGDFCGYGSTWDEWIEDCRKRSHTELGSSKHLHANSTLNLYTYGVDQFANDPTSLTFEWNWIYMMYCDGHYYAGRNTSTTYAAVPAAAQTVGGEKKEPLYFRGGFNVEAILGSIGLLARDDASSSTTSTTTIATATATTTTTTATTATVTDVLVHGCSSGGVAVFSNADHIWSLLPRTANVAAAANSGYYMNGGKDSEYTEYWTRPPYLMANMTSSLNAACMAEQQRTPWNCIVAQVAAPYISNLPIFAWQSRFDSNQLSCVKVDPNNDTAVNAYGKVLEASLQGWVSNASVVARGAYIDSCYRHCGCSKGITEHGWTPRKALGRWWDGLWTERVEFDDNNSVDGGDRGDAGDASVDNDNAGGSSTNSLRPPGPAAKSRAWTQDGVYPCSKCCDANMPSTC